MVSGAESGESGGALMHEVYGFRVFSNGFQAPGQMMKTWGKLVIS